MHEHPTNTGVSVQSTPGRTVCLQSGHSPVRIRAAPLDPSWIPPPPSSNGRSRPARPGRRVGDRRGPTDDPTHRPGGPDPPVRRLVDPRRGIRRCPSSRPPRPTRRAEAARTSRSIRDRAAALRAGDAPPRSIADWTERRTEVRHRLARALGPVPDPPPSLDPASHGTLDRDGYRVEKVTFQTLPGVRMTANLYLPESPGRHPAILAVHGHWRGAKQDPVVQARCIGAAKLGFAVLAVDAFGAGERAVGKALGEYHGEMTAATLLPTGQTLAGLQVYENARAARLPRHPARGRRRPASGSPAPAAGATRRCTPSR